MQKYNNMPNNQNLAKKILSDFLGFLKYKVDNDKLTLEEEQAFARFIEENIPLTATTDDIAQYYGQPPVNVRAVISRKMLDKPKRRVTYPFLKFIRIKPPKWR